MAIRYRKVATLFFSLTFIMVERSFIQKSPFSSQVDRLANEDLILSVGILLVTKRDIKASL